MSMGYFDLLRALHPLRVGDVIDGKRVIRTCYTRLKTGEDIPIFYLAGERQARRVDGKELEE